MAKQSSNETIALSEKLIGLLRKTSRNHQPWQIAVAIVLGCACGLLPKSNLLWPLALAVVGILPIHLPVAVVCFLLFSLFAPVLHPIQGAIGVWLLEGTRLRSTVERLEQFPIVPWLRLHHSIVAGSAAISLVSALPCFLVIHRFLLSQHTRWLAFQARSRFETDYYPLEYPTDRSYSMEIDSSRPTTASDLEPQTIAVDSIHELGVLLEEVASVEASRIDADAVLARATQTAELVDDIVRSLVAETAVEATVPVAQIQADASNESLPSNRIERTDPVHNQVDAFHAFDTTITISRTSQIRSSHSVNNPPNFPSTESYMFTKVQATQLSHSAAFVPPGTQRTTSLLADGALDRATASAQEEPLPGEGIPHEEALRNLLNYLRTTKNEA